MIVSARPHPDIATIFSSTARLESNSLKFYPLGRNALLSGLITLGLKKGDSIIVPAYMCDSTIKPLQSYGFKVVFVDISENLTMPIDKVIKVMKKSNQIKALLVVHYFGMTQDIKVLVDACREYGVKVVEDASHSSMSQLLRDKESIKGDIEIFSMRKTFPIVDGGALRVNIENYDFTGDSNSQCSMKISDLMYLTIRFFEKLLTGLQVNIYGRFINNIKTKLRRKKSNENYDFHAKSCQASWQLRKYLNNEEYLQQSQYVIVNNFNQLSKSLHGIGVRLFVESVGDNVIPQACVIYDNKGGLADYLRLKGIGAWRWPNEEMPKEVVQNYGMYPNAAFFDEKLVLIPIHQSLNDRHIKYITQVISRWKL